MIFQFLGRFHPILVHLPIGILVAGAFLKVYGLLKRTDLYDEIVHFILKISFFASIFTCISGYLLAQNGEYNNSLVSNHQWSGIIFSLLLGLFVFKQPKSKFAENFSWIFLLVFMSVVGHFGGSLTHGEQYLSFNNKDNTKLLVTDIQTENAYNITVRPILESKCYDCHSSKKTKGGLRLDTPNYITKGGKNGDCLVPGSVANSLLIKRMLLPIGEEEHMPPKGKSQLTEDEIEILTWWIGPGKASYESKVSQIPQNSEIKVMLVSYENRNETVELMVGKPSASALESLKSNNILALPLGGESNQVSVNILNKNLSDSQWDQLAKIAQNIVVFKSNHAIISSKGFATIAKFENVHSMNLNYSNIISSNIKTFSKLSKLKKLSLVGCNIGNESIDHLKNLSSLKELYLYGSKLDKDVLKLLPTVKIDTGSYYVPTLLQDTMKYVF